MTFNNNSKEKFPFDALNILIEYIEIYRYIDGTVQN